MQVTQRLERIVDYLDKKEHPYSFLSSYQQGYISGYKQGLRKGMQLSKRRLLGR